MFKKRSEETEPRGSREEQETEFGCHSKEIFIWSIAAMQIIIALAKK